MTNEQMAALIQSDREEFKDLLPILWKKVNRLLFKLARDFYSKHSASCTRRGVELSDIESSCYAVFLAALDAYKPDSSTLFISYFRYPFKTVTQELLGIRTEGGRQEPLNNCDSLDRLIDPEDGEGATLGEFIPDPVSSSLEDDVLEGLNREQEALAVREAVAALPKQTRRVVELYFFENKSLSEIGEELHITAERARQIKYKALRSLRRNKQLQIINYEYQHHKRGAGVSKFRYSPQYYEIVQQLQERCISYGKMQAELLAAESRWDAEEQTAKSLDPADSPELTDKIADVLASYLTEKQQEQQQMLTVEQRIREQLEMSAEWKRKHRNGCHV